MKDLFLLDPTIAFLNHGSFGATPRAVFEEYQRIQRQFELNPVEYHGRRYNELMREAREALGRYVGADPLDLVFVTNATVAMNIVARSLELGPGDVLLTTDHEYGACDRMWELLRRERGFAIDRVEIPVPVTTHDDIVDRITSRFSDHTKALFISHITSPTAVRFPVERICSEARSRGIITIIDGAHAVGQIPLDLGALGADFYTSNLHKWLCAPKGSAFLHARRELQPTLKPLIASWGVDPIVDYDSTFIAHHEYRGTREIAAPLSTAAAIAFQKEHDWEEVRHRCFEIVREARPLIAGRFGFEPIIPLEVPDPENWYTQMSAFLLPEGIDAFAMKDRLYDEHRVEIPVFGWNGRSTIRLSVQGYNTWGDIERLVDALDAVGSARRADRSPQTRIKAARPE